MIIVVAPGQGSQTPGFLSPWLEETSAWETLSRLSEHAEVDLVLHATESDAETIRDTRIAQPLIVAAGILTLQALLDGGGRMDGIAGHSVGEITAAAGAGILTSEDAIRLVAERGRAMAEAAATVETGMSAVVGGDQAVVLDAVEQAGLFPANYNGGGQIVVAGPRAALAALAENPPAGARVIALQVAGAFHTEYMAPAVDRMAAVASTLSPKDPAVAIWTNKDGTRVASGSQFLDLLVGQVSSPVRWDLCMESFAAEGVTGIIELAPAGALTGLAKRALRGVPTVAVKTPADLAAARELMERDS
ncbi:ACP S-malonyltransferase [Naasia sp. SYSU D00948]|uniref:ACP S-malonyltransferase n=1 Tax=Naasia sp. SYSU D00948 TaxID=2817379 RepID=UPI001B316E7D|nr:ACP S-malonyltransferase [Naasia sp. SYSU D00948]